jgi:hypothetical protein
MRKSAGLIYGPMGHHLDHLGPFCSLMGFPLIVTEEALAVSARNYYPGVEVIYWDYLQAPASVVQHFDTIFSSLPHPLFEDIFFLAQKLLRKEVTSVWLPHGNSDKGHASIFMEGLQHDLYALVYGKKMIEFFKEKQAFHQLQSCITIGNFRYTYYLKYKDFYDPLVDQKIPFSGPVILYAPTWRDKENSTSFYEACPILIDHLQKPYNLVIKLHPNLNDSDVDKLITCYENTPCVLFLKDWPPIYPLLQRTSIYIGDMSSIGYDFLKFNRPMFFLNQNRRDLTTDPGLFLHKAGISLMPEEYPQIYSIIKREIQKDQEKFFSIRQEIYSYTFT